MASSSFKKVWREYKQALDDYCKQIREEADRGQIEFSSILEELMNAAESNQYNIPTDFQELFISIPEMTYVGQIWSHMYHQHAVVFIDGPLKDHVHYERMHSMDEIWDSLNEHGVIAATAILQRLRCNEYSDIEKLITLYKSGEKDSFIQQLKSMSCDLSHLYLACEHKPHKADFSLKTDIEDLLAEIDYHSVSLFDEEDDEPLQELFNSYSESTKKWLPLLMSLQDESISETDKIRFINDFLDKGIIEVADSLKLLLKYIIDDTKWMFGFEKEIFTKSIQHPSIQFLLEYEGKNNSAGIITTNVPPEEQEQPVDVAPEMTETKVQNEKESSVFALPSDFFDLPVDRSACEEFFDIEYAVEKGGTKRFTRLLNYIASQGYTDYNNRTKQLLAYILTGRWKPSDYQSGETLTWHDYGREGKELCYIIKSLVASDQGKKATKYDKMHKLFTGPNWSKTVPDKDQGNNAQKKFKEALNDLYPDICKLS